MATTWLNNDKLYIKYGSTAATAAQAGEYRFDGAQHMAEVTVDLTTLTSTAAIISDSYRFLKSARIEKVEVVTDTAATSAGSATLDVGLIQADRSTAVDNTAFVAALAKTAVANAGQTTVLTQGSTSAGTAIGTTTGATAASSYVTARYGTAAFTAGKVRIRIYYSILA